MPDTEIVIAFVEQLGCPVFPCIANAKKPLTVGGFKAATREINQIREWSEKCPAANWAMPTGKMSGFCVLDVDLHEGKNGDETLSALERTHGKLPDTATVLTPSGGRHIWFRANGIAIPSGTDRLGIGLDIKCEGGYVVIPPSIINGREYTWEASSDPAEVGFSELPKWIVELATKKSAKLSDDSAATWIDNIAKGISLHDSLRDLAAHEAALGCAFQEIRQRLEGLMQNSGTAHDSRWRDRFSEIPSLVRSALEKFKPPGHTTAKPDASRRAPEIISARELMSTEFKPVSFLVDGLLPEGAYLLAGRPKIGKSWLALQIAVDVARGVDCLGRKTLQGDVLYLGLEDNKRRMQSRLQSLAPAVDMPACFEAALWWHRLNDGGIDDLLAWAQRVARPRLIVADTIAKLRSPKGRSDDPYAHDYAVGEALKKISDAFTGLTVLAITHVRKAAADDVLDTISGTLGLTGAFDGAAVLDRKRGDAEGTLKIVGRDLEHDIELGVQWLADVARWRIVGDASEVKASAERRRILACLREAKEPLLPSEIAEETGLPRGSVRHLIRKMHTDGMVTRIEGKGRKHKYHVYQ